MYSIPAAPLRTETVITRSRFLVSLAHTPDVDRARAFVAAVRQEFADATHNCWAYVAGPAGDTACVGLSDDGEPHGTAGKPMLSTLLHSGIGEITAVVTRYFGGTKLGTGGLVRAYSGCLRSALSELPTRERITLTHLTLTMDYTHIDTVRQMLLRYSGRILQEQFTERATFMIAVPSTHQTAIRTDLTNLTAGRIHITPE